MAGTPPIRYPRRDRQRSYEEAMPPGFHENLHLKLVPIRLKRKLTKETCGIPPEARLTVGYLKAGPLAHAPDSEPVPPRPQSRHLVELGIAGTDENICLQPLCLQCQLDYCCRIMLPVGIKRNDAFVPMSESPGKPGTKRRTLPQVLLMRNDLYRQIPYGIGSAVGGTVIDHHHSYPTFKDFAYHCRKRTDSVICRNNYTVLQDCTN
ncbi:hypothetical protein SAMN06269301_3130 [Geobacter sp. DSM 9736]|nr:hypothetical protein SAMN06269301_3130 [Geobacter sp. DSM 9736]